MWKKIKSNKFFQLALYLLILIIVIGASIYPFMYIVFFTGVALYEFLMNNTSQVFLSTLGALIGITAILFSASRSSKGEYERIIFYERAKELLKSIIYTVTIFIAIGVFKSYSLEVHLPSALQHYTNEEQGYFNNIEFISLIAMMFILMFSIKLTFNIVITLWKLWRHLHPTTSDYTDLNEKQAKIVFERKLQHSEINQIRKIFDRTKEYKIEVISDEGIIDISDSTKYELTFNYKLSKNDDTIYGLNKIHVSLEKKLYNVSSNTVPEDSDLKKILIFGGFDCIIFDFKRGILFNNSICRIDTKKLNKIKKEILKLMDENEKYFKSFS